MPKIRINKLALELDIQNDIIIDELKKKDIPVKNHMSSIDEEAANYIRELFAPKPEKTAKGKATAKSKAKAKTVTKAKAKAKTTAKAAPKAAAKSTAKATAKAKKAPEKKDAPQKEEGAAAAEAAAETVKAEKGSAAKDAPKTKPASKAKAASKRSKPETGKPGEKSAAQKASRKLGLKIVKKEEQEAKEAQERAEAEKAEQEKKEKEAKKEKARKDSQAAKKAATPAPAPKPEPEEETFEVVKLSDNMALRDVAEALKCSPNEIIKDLMLMGIMATINQNLDIEIASRIADKHGFEVEVITPESELDFEESEDDNENDRISRPPIVTIMGHVDHGKTSLLDAIRKTSVTDTEHGGITQHIGAYQVKVHGQSLTFLDTPGHEAFTAMRARGAQVTDIVVLVVAADDGMKPQTKEAIDHARAANVPILVAINKIDKPDAKPDEVKKQLADYGLLPEDWGGQTIFTPVSAKQGTGLDHLLELLLLQAEILELKANPKLRCRAVVIESHLDRGRGPVATVIIEKGLLKVGDPFIVGNYFGKVRALTNDQGRNISEATLAMPVEVIGLPDVPEPGDRMMVVSDERRARQLSSTRLQREREQQLSQKPRITMEDLHQQIEDGQIQELNLIIKADVQGSIEAVKEAAAKLETKQVRVKIIHGAVGGITESDILLATASNAFVIGFNVRPTEKAKALAEREKVDVRLYSIIYDAIKDMKQAMEGLLAPTLKEHITGRVEIREIFNIPKLGTVAGCAVVQGKVERNSRARLIRDSVVIHDGKIGSLRRFKDDVKEVASGYECGLMFEKYPDVKPGDVVEPYTVEEIVTTLETHASNAS